MTQEKENELMRHIYSFASGPLKELMAEGAAVSALARYEIDSLIKKWKEAENDQELFIVEDSLVDVNDPDYLISVLLDEFKKVEPNSPRSISILTLLANLGTVENLNATAKLLELCDLDSIDGIVARRLLMDYYLQYPSGIINGFLYLMEKNEDVEIPSEITLFMARSLAMSRAYVEAEEAEEMLESLWGFLDYSMGNEEFSEVLRVFFIYATRHVTQMRLLDEPAEYDDSSVSVIGPTNVEPLKRLAEDEQIVRMAKKLMADFLIEITRAKGEELAGLLNHQKINAAVSIVAYFTEEENVKLLAEVHRKRFDILRECQEEDKEMLGLIFVSLAEYLNQPEVKKYLPKRGSRRMRASRDPGQSHMHHEFIRMERISNPVERGCRNPLRMQQELARKLSIL